MIKQSKLATCLMIASLFCIPAVAVHAQFVENFGDQGTFRSLRGQVQDGTETGIPFARLYLKKEGKDEEVLIETDEDGRFRKTDLPNGRYGVEIRVSGFNLFAFSLRLNKQSGSKNFIVAGLSPGCSTGGFGIRLVKSLKRISEKTSN